MPFSITIVILRLAPLCMAVVCMLGNFSYGQNADPAEATGGAEVFNIKESSPELDELFTIVTDKTMELRKREMPGYWIPHSFFKDKSIEELRTDYRSRSDLKPLYLHPGDHRGELVYQKQVVRRIDKESNSDIFQIWCSRDSSPFWLQVLLTDRLPPPFADGNEKKLVGKPIEFIGAFYKLHGFYPASSKPNDKPSMAPLFIGVLNPLEVQSAIPGNAKTFAQSFRPLALAVIGCFFLLSMTLFLARFQKRWKGRSLSVSSDAKPDLSWMHIEEQAVEQSKIKDSEAS